ncbi:ATP-binding cassette long-chain fatty acid transporter pxa1 [Coemansia erecta]|uniref:ATP-binding cassette long-chain fatty acid transporter pxa1 n=1 Tax=Coemansia erecta TaxID=147472 RepID=A0A9W7XXH1_9FUNG|nr:ATP-binding cassette long-chain fatty acid transporter pxa1 [Coemansia erecta]
MPAVNSKPSTRYASPAAAAAGLPLRSLGSAALLSLLVIVYSYTVHKKTAAKAKKSMLNAASALSALSMANLRGAATSAYTAAQWTENDERERRFDKDAPHFPSSLIDKAATQPGAAEAKNQQPQQPQQRGRRQGAAASGKLDRAFFQQLRALRRIIIPSVASKEAGIIALHTVFLVLRTWLSVIVAELDGKIVKHLVRGQGRKFLAGLLSWFAIAIPATYTNSMIRFLESKLALAFRTRLTHYVHDLYMNDNLTYYKLLALDKRIANPDQFITTDIARFCGKLASFLSNLGKPTLDTIIFNIQLVRGVGLQGTVGMFAMYMATASLLRAWTPPFGRMAAAQARLEGEFRANHSRVITNAEEIAFYRGEEREAEQLQGSLHRLLAHARSVARRKISHVVLEDLVIKYTWSAFGYLVCALPFFMRPALAGAAAVSAMSGTAGSSSNDGGYRTQRFVTNKRILVNLSDAGGRIMYSIKEVMELTGYTSRVYSLISTLHALRRDEFEKPTADDPSLYPEYSLSSLQGALYEDIDGIRFTNVPVVAPSVDPDVGGELLVRPLTWEVRRGQHWMVSGPNGVGKSSVLRVLSGLWPVFAGIVERPEPGEIIYIPQRPYLSLGSLRDQIIYPHTYAEMLALGRTDEELVEVLHAVHLAYLPAREGGFAARKEWKDVLSGGEKQRINLARLFYHLPRFAVLDECTSAVSSDVEGLMYEHAKRLGITLVTISHRPALYKYHTYLLRLGVAESPAGSRPESVRLSSDVTEDVRSDVGSDDEGGAKSRAPTVSTATEPWESDVDEFGSLGDSVASGVLWDVVRLSNSASMDISASTVSSPPLSSASSVSSLESPSSPPSPLLRPAVPTSQPGTMRAVISTTDMARRGSMAAIRSEIEQLRSALAAKKAVQSDLEARLAHVQRELTAVTL